jgi:very-short-patch-repair endonuclease
MGDERRLIRPEAGKLAARALVRVAQVAADQWGVMSLADLLACGMTENAVEVRARGGVLHRIHRGVYAVGHPGLPVEGRFLAAVKACGPSAVLSHLAAGYLWGFVEEEPEVVDITVTREGSRPGRATVRVHRSALEPGDVGRRAAIPVTTPVRTLADLAATVSEHELRRLVRRAHAMSRVRVRQLVAVHRRRRGYRGNGQLGRVLTRGVAATRSELEDVVLDLILDAGLKPPDVNRPLRIEGRTVVPDFRWADQRLVVEADSAAWHDNPIARAEDIERQRVLEATGEQVIRVSWPQAVGRPEQTVGRIRAAGAPLRDERRVPQPEAG